MRFAPSITRRDILRLGGATMLAGTTGGRAFGAAKQQAQMPLVVDSSVNCGGAAGALEKLGVKAVVRYYARKPQRGYKEKILTAAEAKALFDCNVAIALSYQHNNRVITSFDHQAAIEAADYCINRHAKGGKDFYNQGLIDHPDGTAIYFGIDTDFPPTSKRENGETVKNDEIILAYFDTIGRRFKNSPFAVGVYGPGRFCRMLAQEKLAAFFWLPGSTGWAETPEFYNGKRGVPLWNIYQKAVEVPAAMVRIDTNIINPKTNGLIGAFRKGALIGPINNGALVERERFVKRQETFRITPGGAPIVRNVEVEVKKAKKIVQRDFIERRKMVTLIETTADQAWCKIEGVFTEKNDIRESEKGVIRQGYVRADSLVSIDQMPE
jgi:Domain of unknown function (DUF1906)